MKSSLKISPLLWVLCGTLLSQTLFAQSITFERTYGDRLFFRDLTVSGSNFLTAGNALDSLGVETGWVFKLNEEGDPIWSQAFAGKGSTSFSAIEPVGDGCLVAGSTETASFTGKEGYLVRLNDAGDTIWTQTLALGPETSLFAIAPLPDGGFAISGRSGPPGGGLLDAVLFRIDATGNQLWVQNYGTAGLEQFFDLTVSNDGGFTMVGSFFDLSIDRVYMIHADADGNQLWARTFSHAESDFGYAIVQTPSDNGYLIAGQGVFSGNAQGIVLKTDSLGVFQWEKDFGTPGIDRFRDLQINEDEEITACGSFGKISGSTQAGIFMLNEFGDSILTRLYGGPGNDEFFAVSKDGTGGWIFAGAKDNQAYLVRTGTTGIVCQEPYGLSASATWDQAELSWDPLPGLLGYRVEYREFGSGPFTSVISPVSNSTLLGLSPETLYQWRVASTCTSSENSPYSSLDTFFTGQAPSGIASIDALKIQAYPNPFFSAFKLNNEYRGKITITDLRGREVWSEEISAHATVAPDLSTGLYLMRFETEQAVEAIPLKILKR